MHVECMLELVKGSDKTSEHIPTHNKSLLYVGGIWAMLILLHITSRLRSSHICDDIHKYSLKVCLKDDNRKLLHTTCTFRFVLVPFQCRTL